MHDPLTVAHTIYYPWNRPKEAWRRHEFLVVWHRDPEKGGSDDSCDWFNRHRPLKPDERAIVEAVNRAGSLFGNPPHFISSYEPDEEADLMGREPLKVRASPRVTREHAAYHEICEAVNKWQFRHRRWRLTPRWHIWHWRLQIIPLQHFKRWAFSRCARCGRHFRWGYSPVANQWDGTGPLWFRSERDVSHGEEAAQDRKGG